MKAAKKRYHYKVKNPPFWKALKEEHNNDPSLTGYKGFTASSAGYFYCPYIPLQTYSGTNLAANVTLSINGLGTRYVKTAV